MVDYQTSGCGQTRSAFRALVPFTYVPSSMFSKLPDGLELPIKLVLNPSLVLGIGGTAWTVNAISN